MVTLKYKPDYTDYTGYTGYKQIDGFCLKDSEEGLLSLLLPQYYIDKVSNLSIDYALRFLQNELHDLLNSFLNGGCSFKGYVLYPFFKDISKENTINIKRLKKVIVFLNNNGHDFSNSINKFNYVEHIGYIGSKSFALLISTLYNDLYNDNHLSEANYGYTKPVKKGKCEELNISDYRKEDLRYLTPLSELKDYAIKNLRPYLIGFYLHGSLSTMDYIKGWSDVDTLSVVSSNTINNPKALLELRQRIYNMRYFFYGIDPLQHHGSIVISEHELNNYCQTYFPVPIFKYAKSFFKEDSLDRFRVRDFSSESIAKCFWFVNYFRKLSAMLKTKKDFKDFRLGSYDTKILFHSITLFPTIYLQAKGILVYKKFSFDIAKKDFKKDIWKIIEEVSSIRSNWKGFGSSRFIQKFSKLNPLLFYQLNSRIMDIFKNTNKDNKINTDKIIKSMFWLSEDAWGRSKEKFSS